MLNRFVKLAILASTAVGSSYQVHAAELGELRCEPKILHYAVQAFNTAKAKGLVAFGRDNQRIPLGSSVSVRSVEVQNIFKDSLRVRFYIN